MPPEWMWPLGWEMEKALDKVTAARRKKYGIEDEDDDMPDGVDNELLPEWAREG